jgi:hypothetical protein
MGPKSFDDLAAYLQRFGLERDRMRAALARHAGVSGTDLDALEHLEADGPLTQRDLGERLSITSDRRYILIELSTQAAEHAPTGLATYHSSIQALVAGVPSQQRRAIATFLEAAAGAASKAAQDLYRGPGTAGRRER